MAQRSNIALAAPGLVLAAAGALIKWSVAPAVIKAPLDVSSTTVAEGESQVFVLAAQAVNTVPVLATRVVHGDTGAGNSSIAVYDETLCLVAQGTTTDKAGCAPLSDPGFIEKTTDRVAFDRKSAMAVTGANYKAAVNGDASVVHHGLDYTFPIGTNKSTYSVFDTSAGKAFAAHFAGTASIHGLSVYKFVQQVPATPIKIQSLIPGTYSGTTTFWVEPTTGVIVKGAQQISEKFASDAKTVFDGTLTFTDKTVRQQADFAKSQLTKIDLVRLWIPLGVAVIGVLLVFAAWFRGRRGDAKARAVDADAPEGERRPASPP